MEFSLYFDLKNAAFDAPNTAAAIAAQLRDIAAEVEGLNPAGLAEEKILDANGNTIGAWFIEDDNRDPYTHEGDPRP